MTTTTTERAGVARASAGLDHERLRDAIADLPQLLRIADQARGFYGPLDCAEGECDHIDGPQQCPLLQVRYATAEDLELLDNATATLRYIGTLAQQGLRANPADGLDLFQRIADLAGSHTAHNQPAPGGGAGHDRTHQDVAAAEVPAGAR